MKRIAFALVITLLLLAALAIHPHPVLAQDDWICQTTNATDGWAIHSGNLRSEDGVVIGTNATLTDGTPIKSARIYKYFGGTKRLGFVAVNWLYQGIGTGDAILAVTLYSGNTPITTRKVVRSPALSLTWFPLEYIYFNFEEGDSILIWAYHQRNGSITQIALRPEAVCWQPLATATPSATIPIETDTPTPSPTPTGFTPSPTFTPSNTPTPSPTVTPGGPTLTPNPSVTPTLLPGVAAGGYATVPPPQACTDPGVCSAFPVPAFPTLNLPSPTTLPSTTARATATLAFQTATLATGTATGTATGFPTFGTSTYTAPTPTGTLPTATLTSGESSVEGFATEVGNMVAGISLTPQFDGGKGAVDIRNSANEIGSYIGQFWGFVRAIQGLFLGRAGLLLAFLLLLMAFIMTVRFICLAIPIVLALIRWIMRIINLFKP